MLEWLASLTDTFMFWKAMLILAVVGVVSFINGYREQQGLPPLWQPPVPLGTGRDQETAEASPPKAIPDARERSRGSR